MPNTSKGLPYPSGADTPAGHTQLMDLAEAVDDRVLGHRVAAGVVSVSLSNSASGTAAVTFPPGLFTNGAQIMVLCQKSSVAGAASGLVENVYNVSHTGCTVALSQASGTAVTVSATVAWVAVQLNQP